MAEPFLRALRRILPGEKITVEPYDGGGTITCVVDKVIGIDHATDKVGLLTHTGDIVYVTGSQLSYLVDDIRNDR